MSFQDYVEELRLLESRIESIRTGEMAGDSLDLLTEEDAEVVSTNIQGMIEAFVDLGENVATVKNRYVQIHESQPFLSSQQNLSVPYFREYVLMNSLFIF